jgi:hypothetical protein
MNSWMPCRAGPVVGSGSGVGSAHRRALAHSRQRRYRLIGSRRRQERHSPARLRRAKSRQARQHGACPAMPSAQVWQCAQERNGRTLAADLVRVYATWSSTLRVRQTAAVWHVLPLLLGHPAVTSAVVQEATGLSQPAAHKVIKQLREAGILTKASGVQRYVVWVANDVTRALDGFAVPASVGRCRPVLERILLERG